MSLDIFNPTVSVVPKGLEGKIILLAGSNSVGKTKQATQMSKPYVLAFEKGLNAISGVPYANIEKWADFRKVNKQLTGKDKDKARENFDTIIFDTVEAAALMNEKYVAGQHGAPDIASGNGGFGLWKNLEAEFYEQIALLTGAGYTVVFISHVATDRDTGQIVPKGDKRSIGIVRDIADIIVYLESNGVDEDGNVVLSTGYVRETPEYFARSRFDLMPNVIDPFTAENLKDAIITGIEREEQAGGTTVSYDEFVEQNTNDKLVFSELQDKLNNMGKAYMEAEILDVFTEAMADTFGGGEPIKVGELNDKQVEAISVFIDDMTDKYKELTEEQE